YKKIEKGTLFPPESRLTTSIVKPYALKTAMKAIPIIPAVKPILYKLKPLWKLAKCRDKGGRINPTKTPARKPNKIPMKKGSPILNEISLTRGARAVPNKAESK